MRYVRYIWGHYDVWAHYEVWEAWAHIKGGREGGRGGGRTAGGRREGGREGERGREREANSISMTSCDSHCVSMLFFALYFFVARCYFKNYGKTTVLVSKHTQAGLKISDIGVCSTSLAYYCQAPCI